jgi:hypothetical protein
MSALSLLDLSLLALAATLVGLSKTALPGAGTITVAVFAASTTLSRPRVETFS